MPAPNLHVLRHEFGHALAALAIGCQNVMIVRDPQEPTGLMTAFDAPRDLSMRALVVAGGLVCADGVDCADDVRDLERFSQRMREGALKWARVEIEPLVEAMTAAELLDAALELERTGCLRVFPSTVH